RRKKRVAGGASLALQEKERARSRPGRDELLRLLPGICDIPPPQERKETKKRARCIVPLQKKRGRLRKVAPKAARTRNAKENGLEVVGAAEKAEDDTGGGPVAVLVDARAE